MERLGTVLAADLAQRAAHRSDIWVIDGDLADSTGADTFAHLCPSRFIQSGIAEQTAVSLAAGLASFGMRPWVFSFAAFLCYRAYDQIRTNVSQTGLPVVLVGSHSGGLLGRNGKSHTALNDLALMSMLPSFQIWTPGDAEDVALCVQSILSSSEPAYVRLPRDEQQPLGCGSSCAVRWLTAPTEIAIAGHGQSTAWALSAQQTLARQGANVGVVHFAKMPTTGRDVEILGDVKRLFVVEDHYTAGGLADVLRRASHIPVATTFGWPPQWAGQSGDSASLRRRHGMSSEQIAGLVLAELKNG